jgi:hypothetical protein
MFGDAAEHVAQISFWIKTVELGGLCRHPNYAERSGFPHYP